MNPVEKSSVLALADALSGKSDGNDTGTETVADFVQQLLREPDKRKRKQMIKDFSARRADVAKFIKENEELINAEAEMALISAAVGSTQTEKEISHRGTITRKKQSPPNVAALNIYLKNKMPDKYSDKPQTVPELEDTAEIEEDIYGNGNKA